MHLDWTIVRNTEAFKKIADGEKFLQELATTVDTAWPTSYQVQVAALKNGRAKELASNRRGAPDEGAPNHGGLVRARRDKQRGG